MCFVSFTRTFVRTFRAAHILFCAIFRAYVFQTHFICGSSAYHFCVSTAHCTKHSPAGLPFRVEFVCVCVEFFIGICRVQLGNYLWCVCVSGFFFFHSCVDNGQWCTLISMKTPATKPTNDTATRVRFYETATHISF